MRKIRIGAFSKKHNVTQNTVRHYLDMGLLTSKKSGGQYFFHEKDGRDMEEIIKLKQLGFNLNEILNLLTYLRLTGIKTEEYNEMLLSMLKDKKIEINKVCRKYEKMRSDISENIENLQKTSEKESKIIGFPIAYLGILTCPDCKSKLKINNGIINNNMLIEGAVVCPCGYQAKINYGVFIEEKTVRKRFLNGNPWPSSDDYLKVVSSNFINFVHSGMSKIYEGRNIPRIHMTEGGNGYIMKYLFETAEKIGVETHLNTPATELIKEGNTVVGAKAVDKDGNEITIKAEAVIVASGGFAGNKELMAKYYPQYTDYVNTSVNTGDSLMFAEAVGADIIVKNALQLHHNLINDTSLGYFTPECIYVTPEGERYVDEAEYFYTRTRTLNEKGFGDTHMIVPQALYETKKDSTIDRYNELVVAGVDSDFNKPSEFLFPVEAPYIGLDLTGNLNDTYVSMRINNNAQVIDTEGNVIEGLYAAGAAASAQTLNQEYIGSGSALLNGLTFGRVAAAHAASLLEN